MWIVRPARPDDIAGIERLAVAQGARVSTLPQAADKLAEKIDHASRSLAGEASTRGRERFLFVLEETDTGEILGTAGLDAHAGNGQPFYNYLLDELIHACHELNVTNRVEVLYVSHELTGRPLLCSFTIADSVRDTPAFELLSRTRLLFIDQHRDLFGDEVIVEIQGVQDDDGNSPFWDSLGRHFFEMDFATADHYSAIKSKTFIAELMPPHPIYVTLLSEAAQSALGKAHSAASKTCQLLKREGFKMVKHVDIFDGGPTLEAHVDDITSLRNRQHRMVELGEQTQGVACLVASANSGQFRCTLALADPSADGSLRLAPETAAALQVEDGQTVSLVAL